METTPKKGHSHRQWIIAIAANLSLISHGILSGWMSPMSQLLRSENTPTAQPLTDIQTSWIASAFYLTAALAVALYAYIADAWGRKFAMVFIVMVQTTSWIIKFFAPNVIGLIVARAISGVSGGGCFIIIPMYVKEISHSSIRGRLGTLAVMCQNLGILLVYTMGSYVSYSTLILVSLVVPVLNLLMLIKCPESPAFLVKIGKEEEAANILSNLRALAVDDKNLQAEIEAMKNENINKNNEKPISFTDIFTNLGYMKAFLVVIGMLTLQSGNGMVVILAYAASIMADAGVTISPQLQTMTFPAIMIIGSLISMVLIENAGRKILFISSVALSAVALGVLGYTLQLQSKGGVTPEWIPVTTIMVTAFAYATGVCSIPYIVMAEMFNVQLRSKLIGIIVTYAWTVSFTQLFCLSTVTNAFGLHTIFFWYAGVNVFGLLFALFFLPETKGKSIEEIEKHFSKKK